MREIQSFYDEHAKDEWERLKRHRMEFAVTMRALKDYLPPAPAKILDVGGGPDMVIQALLDGLGLEGTLMMYVGWEDDPYKLTEWPEEWQKAYLEECPPFDPQRSRAHRKWSILTEYLRTWPGAFRSDHPEASVAAVGAKAQWITADHPLNYPYGPGSPLAKLCEARGKVLLLGAPLNTLTILHHAETIARIPNKRVLPL